MPVSSDGVLGRFALQGRERKSKETLGDRDHSGSVRMRLAIEERVDDAFIVCQAAQLNRNNEPFVPSLSKTAAGPRGSSNPTVAPCEGGLQEMNVFDSTLFLVLVVW